MESRGNKDFDHIRRRFQGLVNVSQVFGARFSRDAESAQIDPFHIDIYEKGEALAYPAVVNGQCTRDAAPFSFASLMAHELGHHYPQAVGRPMSSEDDAMKPENVYLKSANMPARCAH